MGGSTVSFLRLSPLPRPPPSRPPSRPRPVYGLSPLPRPPPPLPLQLSTFPASPSRPPSSLFLSVLGPLAFLSENSERDCLGVRGFSTGGAGGVCSTTGGVGGNSGADTAPDGSVALVSFFFSYITIQNESKWSQYLKDRFITGFGSSKDSRVRPNELSNFFDW